MAGIPIFGQEQKTEGQHELKLAGDENTPPDAEKDKTALTPSAPEPDDEDSSVAVGTGGETSDSASGGPLEVPSGPTPEPAVEENVMSWEIYHDDSYGFQVRYPSDFVVEAGDAPAETGALHQVSFQDEELAKSDTAALEPAKFLVRVFDNSAGLSARAWVVENGGFPEKTEIKPEAAMSDVDSVRVTTLMMVAPNMHIFYAKGQYIIQVTPLGARGELMLETFEVIQ